MKALVLFLLGQKGYEVLNAAISGGYKDMVQLVVIGNDNNVHKDFFNEIEALCDAYHIKHCVRTESLELPNGVMGYIAIAAGWRWLINSQFRQTIVFHDSLLPKYRGFNPLVTAMLNLDSETGVTAIIANKDFDCGDIVEKKSIGLVYPIKIQDAINKISCLYFDLAQSIFSKIERNGCLLGVPQDERSASYSVWRDEEDYRIDWNKSSDYIEHFVKCLSFPYKGASTIFNGSLIRILDAKIEKDVQVENRDVGKVLFVIDGKPIVICGVGLLRINAAVDEGGQDVLPFKNFRTRLL